MTATLQPETKSPSRRALLTGALGGIGALAATVIGRASPVRATNGDPVTVGSDLTGTSTTKITVTTNGFSAIWGNATGATGSSVGVRGDTAAAGGYGVFGNAAGGTGVRGASASGMGVQGQSGTGIGVNGFSDSYHGVDGASNTGVAVYGGSTSNIGVWGLTNSNTGVYGFSGAVLANSKVKTGVYGYANQDIFASGVSGESPLGVGVRGKTTSGYAGYFEGRVYTNAFYELGEIATPAAPLANRARLFVRDNGAGKTQLCVRFRTGSVRVISTEP